MDKHKIQNIKKLHEIIFQLIEIENIIVSMLQDVQTNQQENVILIDATKKLLNMVHIIDGVRKANK